MWTGYSFQVLLYLQDKSLKQKIMNELAQAIIAKDGASLSISEHDEIVRRIKSEAAQAHKEMRGSMSVGPKSMFIISRNYSLLKYYYISALIWVNDAVKLAYIVYSVFDEAE